MKGKQVPPPLVRAVLRRDGRSAPPAICVPLLSQGAVRVLWSSSGGKLGTSYRATRVSGSGERTWIDCTARRRPCVWRGPLGLASRGQGPGGVISLSHRGLAPTPRDQARRHLALASKHDKLMMYKQEQDQTLTPK